MSFVKHMPVTVLPLCSGGWVLGHSPPAPALYLRLTLENTLGASSKDRSLIGPYGRQASIIKSGAMERLHSSVKWRGLIEDQKPTWSNCGQGQSETFVLRI